MTPREAMLQGAALLEPVLAPHGFAFVLTSEGRGSGGDFACGEFVRGDRRLELHVRQSLGMVSYHVRDASVSHQAYMNELGRRADAAYPGFSDDPLAGFRHLGSDLQRFAHDFIIGDAGVVLRAAAGQRPVDASRTKAHMAGAVGDVSARAAAKLKFDASDWQGALALLEALKYPEQMDAADRRRLEIARHRAGAS